MHFYLMIDNIIPLPPLNALGTLFLLSINLLDSPADNIMEII